MSSYDAQATDKTVTLKFTQSELLIIKSVIEQYGSEPTPIEDRLFKRIARAQRKLGIQKFTRRIVSP